MFKYFIAYYIERLHRYCFDVIYTQDHKITKQDRVFIGLLNACQRIIPDYREYLRKWHEDKKTKYLRYKSYEW